MLCESEWTPGVGQGGLACCDSWGHKESDTTEWLNWTELNWSSVSIGMLKEGENKYLALTCFSTELFWKHKKIVLQKSSATCTWKVTLKQCNSKVNVSIKHNFHRNGFTPIVHWAIPLRTKKYFCSLSFMIKTEISNHKD